MTRTMLLVCSLVVLVPACRTPGPMTKADFNAEFGKYVAGPCYGILARWGGLDDAVKDSLFMSAKDMAELFRYRFTQEQLQAFRDQLREQELALQLKVRDKLWSVRKAWYKLAVKRCARNLPR